MDYMFYGCSSLISLNISNFKTNSYTKINSMFRDCSSLTLIDLSSLNMQNSNFVGIFHGCSSLKYINMESFNNTNISFFNELFDKNIPKNGIIILNEFFKDKEEMLKRLKDKNWELKYNKS